LIDVSDVKKKAENPPFFREVHTGWDISKFDIVLFAGSKKIKLPLEKVCQGKAGQSIKKLLINYLPI
jgi:hypothetical protein